jgi:hypothetical protein
MNGWFSLVFSSSIFLVNFGSRGCKKAPIFEWFVLCTVLYVLTFRALFILLKNIPTDDIKKPRELIEKDAILNALVYNFVGKLSDNVFTNVMASADAPPTNVETPKPKYDKPDLRLNLYPVKFFCAKLTIL